MTLELDEIVRDRRWDSRARRIISIDQFATSATWLSAWKPTLSSISVTFITKLTSYPK